MKFYNREKELAILKNIAEQSQEESQMTVLVGRRRIGKTSLLLKSTDGKPTLYFFILRKAENLLCRDFIEEAEMKLNFPYRRIFFHRKAIPTFNVTFKRTALQSYY